MFVGGLIKPLANCKRAVKMSTLGQIDLLLNL